MDKGKISTDLLRALPVIWGSLIKAASIAQSIQNISTGELARQWLGKVETKKKKNLKSLVHIGCFRMRFCNA
jgi:hypothetical protein